MNLFLIGLPGSGKSTLGKALSRLLNLKLIDTDAAIIAAEGDSIEGIFKKQGESYFRKAEQKMLHQLASQDQLLISTGGGMPCFFDNIDFMNSKGVSVFIDVPVETIHSRLVSQRHENRPMLENKTDEEVLNFLKQKYEERFPFYSKANITVQGSNIQAEEIINLLKIKGVL